MTNIIVLSQDNAEQYSSDKPYAVISITNPTREYANLKIGLGLTDVLRMKFWDINDAELAKQNNLRYFTEQDADNILNFYDKVKDKVEILMIHCQLGLSRSAAVGAALTKITGGNERQFFVDKRPNSLIYTTILKREIERFQIKHQRWDLRKMFFEWNEKEIQKLNNKVEA